MFRLRGCTCLPPERPDESTLMPLWLTATTTSLKTMRAIHCHEYGDAIEIPPHPSTHPPHPCIFPMKSQLRGCIFPVRRKRSGHEALACILQNKRPCLWMLVSVKTRSCDFSSHHTAINPGQLVRFSNLEIPQNMGVCSEFLENTGTWSDQSLNSSPHHS